MSVRVQKTNTKFHYVSRCVSILKWVFDENSKKNGNSTQKAIDASGTEAITVLKRLLHISNDIKNQ